MIYFLTALCVVFYAQMVFRFWLAVHRQAASSFLQATHTDQFTFDIIGLGFGAGAFFWWAYDGLNFTFPVIGRDAFASWECTLYAVCFMCASLVVGYFNGRERFTNPTHAGIDEAALRWCATRYLITAAEMAHKLKTMQRHQARPEAPRSGRIIDAGVQEVRK